MTVFRIISSMASWPSVCQVGIDMGHVRYLNGTADGLTVQEAALRGQNGFQIKVVARQGIRLGQSKAVALVFPIEAEGKT